MDIPTSTLIATIILVALSAILVALTVFLIHVPAEHNDGLIPREHSEAVKGSGNDEGEEAQMTGSRRKRSRRQQEFSDYWRYVEWVD